MPIGSDFVLDCTCPANQGLSRTTPVALTLDYSISEYASLYESESEGTAAENVGGKRKPSDLVRGELSLARELIPGLPRKPSRASKPPFPV